MSKYCYDGCIHFDQRVATIASSGTVSDVVSLEGLGLVGIITPAALTGTTFTFKASFNEQTFWDLYDTSGNQISITVAADRYIPLCPGDFIGIDYIKVVSGSAEGAERQITLVSRSLT